MKKNGYQAYFNNRCNRTAEGVSYSLKETYRDEHFEMGNPMPAHLVPFSPDGFGNHYCFDVKSHHIVFWEHDVDYTQHHPIVICKSLAEFIQNEMINGI